MSELEKLLKDEKVNNRVIQFVLRASDYIVVELALLRMDNESRERIFINMSKNARRFLEDSLKEMEDEEATTAASGEGGFLSASERDALKEIGNVSMSAAAELLSNKLSKKVEIIAPMVAVIPSADLQKEYSGQHVVVEVTYTSGLEGTNVLILKDEDAALIADLMMGGNGRTFPELLNQLYLSAIGEVMSQMMGASSTSISTIINKRIELLPTKVDLLDLNDGSVQLPFINDHDFIVKVNFRMVIEDLVDSKIVQIIPLKLGRLMADGLLGSGSVEEDKPPAARKIDEEKILYAQSLLSNLIKKYLEKGDIEEMPAPPKELPQINIENEKEIIKTFSFLANYAKRFGLLALDGIQTKDYNPVLQKGLQYIVDGWDPFVVQKLLENYKKSYLTSVEKQLDMIIEGVLGIQHGDDPRVIEEQLNSHL